MMNYTLHVYSVKEEVIGISRGFTAAIPEDPGRRYEPFPLGSI
jgi:hypothetical protein